MSNQTTHHILFQCNSTETSLKNEALYTLQKLVGDEQAAIESNLVLLKACKNPVFVQKVGEMINQQMKFLNKDIQL